MSPMNALMLTTADRNNDLDTVSLTCALSFNMVHSPEDHFCGLCQAIVCRDVLTTVLDGNVPNECCSADYG